MNDTRIDNDNDKQVDTDDIVEHKVRRRVAKKVLKDIQRQVEDIEQQVATEKRATRLLLPVSLLIVLVAVAVSFWPEILRLVSALIDGG